MQSLADAYRLIHNLVRVGTIADVDTASAVPLHDGDLLTEWLPWPEHRARTTGD
ncbi:Phage-related baseplate assembly protein V [Salinisphaera sp. T5B8]|uniref:hypothetical protein n=1 Tax=Salinisphaera sp. T5B8 TaxID=1304154 RepID=UPI00333E2468